MRRSSGVSAGSSASEARRSCVPVSSSSSSSSYSSASSSLARPVSSGRDNEEVKEEEDAREAFRQTDRVASPCFESSPACQNCSASQTPFAARASLPRSACSIVASQSRSSLSAVASLSSRLSPPAPDSDAKCSGPATLLPRLVPDAAAPRVTSPVSPGAAARCRPATDGTAELAAGQGSPPRRSRSIQFPSFARPAFAAPALASLFFGREAESEKKARPTDWLMPDSRCSLCFACSVPFSTFLRRHHCRQCGLVFCHTCASAWGDGAPLGFGPGLVRLCLSCSRIAQQEEKERGEQTERIDLWEGDEDAHTDFEEDEYDEEEHGEEGEFEEEDAFGEEEEKKRAGRVSGRSSRTFSSWSLVEEEVIRNSRTRSGSPSVPRPSEHECPFLSRSLPRPTAFCSAGEAAWYHLRVSVELHCRLVGLSTLHARILFDLALSVVCALHLEASTPSSPPSVFDFVKIKRLPGLSIADSFFVHGVVFPLHLQCKQQARRLLRRPRLLLLSSFLGLPREYPPSRASAKSLSASPAFAASLNNSPPHVSPLSPLAATAPPETPASPAALGPPGPSDPTKETPACVGGAQADPRASGVCASPPGAAYTRLQILREQEETYTAILIQKILALRPALIVTSEGASQLIQDELRSLGICLLLHVPERTLRRISRCSGAPVLSSLDRAAARAVTMREEEDARGTEGLSSFSLRSSFDGTQVERFAEKRGEQPAALKGVFGAPRNAEIGTTGAGRQGIEPRADSAEEAEIYAKATHVGAASPDSPWAPLNGGDMRKKREKKKAREKKEKKREKKEKKREKKKREKKEREKKEKKREKKEKKREEKERERRRGR
ncbi:FYVE zinc finger domain-containing protein [Toxoplasma gondii RUB]|uniref:FYVE zinc finger domain-containing protein n=1 Tax=Toxoplasma gondii RUB TaxID=935652 RepID=A0A086M7V9_TOXGO|nr:FYVE zinc finger domain-containing protein [Toxoplasma gondii RUB]